MKITKTMQKVAVDILMEFMFTRDMNEVIEAYNRVFDKYGLCEDPFTSCPCTPDETLNVMVQMMYVRAYQSCI